MYGLEITRTVTVKLAQEDSKVIVSDTRRDTNVVTMEWMVVNTLQMHSTFASLGSQVGDTYVVSDKCLATLNEILNKLLLEDRTLRTFRRAIGFSQVVKKDLIPLLINVKDDHRVLDMAIRVLVNLTLPLECLLPTEVMFKTDAGRNTIFELNKLFVSVKGAFTDPRSTRAVVDHIKKMIEKEKRLSIEECDSINNCLLLLRNILHIPESWENSMNTSGCCTMQNQTLWNLFCHGIDKVLIHLITCDQKDYWAVTIVQLIALMYKDQHVVTLQKLLNQWFEASLSESSEDNESNTSPPHKGSTDSSPMSTSDSSDTGGSNNKTDNKKYNTNPTEATPTSHKQHLFKTVLSHFEANKTSTKYIPNTKRKGQTCIGTIRKTSSTNKTCNNKKERTSDLDSQTSSHNSSSDIHMSTKQGRHLHKVDSTTSEPSDCGYGTQIETQESFSTSSNEEENDQLKRPVHQKPHSNHKIRNAATKQMAGPQEKRESRRKKLVKRSRTSIVNMKALMHHTPTEEDISHLLKEFTVDFLLKGYGCLVQELHRQLIYQKNNTFEMDTSHFFWLVTYFLKFAIQLELDLELISSVLSYDIISYLTYEGVNLSEQLEISTQQHDGNRDIYLRRMHLVVTSIRELLQAIDTYKKVSHLSSSDREHLIKLQLQISSTEDLKCLFVLLLRQYDDSLQSRQYLQDLVITNHILLLFLDNVCKLPDYKGTSNMTDHIAQFANVEVMNHYGLLLEDFRNNGEFVNNCIFTMMHHIGGELEQTSTLFQPNILKAFTQIWETDYEVCDDWADLIDYVMKKFVRKPKQNLMILDVEHDTKETSQDGDKIWTRDESDNLYWYYIQSASEIDPIGKVMRLYSDNGITNKTRIGIIQQLFTQDAITRCQYDEFMKMETLKSAEKLDKNMDCPVIDKNVLDAPTSMNTCNDDLMDMIKVLKENLIKEKKEKHLVWLQKVLLEACYVKLCVSDKNTINNNHIMEPVPHTYTLLNQSIPVVPWNSDQKAILLYPPFILLLHKLGFHLQTESGKLFPRIPEFWTPNTMFQIAERLGPVDTSVLKFDVKLLHSSKRKCSSGDVGHHLARYSVTHNPFLIPTCKQVSSPTIRFTPKPEPGADWFQLVTKSHNIAQNNTSSSLLLLSSDATTTAPTSPSRSSLLKVCCDEDSYGHGLISKNLSTLPLDNKCMKVI